MKVKALMLLLLLLVICLGLVFWPDDKYIDKTAAVVVGQTKSNKNQITPALSPTIEPTKEPTSTVPSQGKSTVEQQELLSEINNRMFSDDPYVELYSLDWILGLCSDAQNLPDLFLSMQEFIYPKQQALIRSVKAKCQHHSNNYPKLITMNRKQRLASFSSNSRLGQLLKNKQDYRSMSTEERSENDQNILYEAIVNQNSAVLIESSFEYLYARRNTGILSATLQSKDISYMARISQLALVNMACQFPNAETCDSSGVVMVLICSQQPESCGLDFLSWYHQNTMPGMQADVDTLVDYYLGVVD